MQCEEVVHLPPGLILRVLQVSWEEISGRYREEKLHKVGKIPKQILMLSFLPIDV